MQLNRVFAEHIFQNSLNFRKSAWETSLYASMCAWNRIERLESLPLSCVSFLHLCQNVANIFNEKICKYAFASFYLHPFNWLHIQSPMSWIIHCSKKKKRCREVNRRRNTNNILLPLLFTIKRCLSISLKTSVQIRHTIGTASAMSGSKRH